MKNITVDRFDSIASNYATSEVHKWSPSLELLHQAVEAFSSLEVCDVACGAGHLSLSFADKAKRVVAVDPSANMLKVCQRQAEERGVTVETVESFAEQLPLPDQQFDLVASRLAAHHFVDVQQAVCEMARITREGGLVAMIDLQGYEDQVADAFNHQVELLHDPTHGKSYTATEWRSYFEKAGLYVESVVTELSEQPDGVSVKRWCEIASSGEEAEHAINRLLSEAPESMLQALGIRQVDDEFKMPVRTLLIFGKKQARG